MKQLPQWLGEHVYDQPETLADRQHNDKMMELARQIRTKRMIDISSAYYGITKKGCLDHKEISCNTSKSDA